MTDNTSDDLVVVFASTDINESEKYALLHTSARNDLTDVRLYEETVDHVKAEHAAQFPVELPSIIRAVGTTIEEPTNTSDSYNNSVEFVNENAVNRKGHPLRVYVQKHTGTTSGHVTTFFYASRQGDDDD